MALLDDRVALVTGGGRGIGRAIALALAAAGAQVAVAGRRETELREAADAIQAAGGRALAVRCDVSAPAEVEGAVRQVRETLGLLDIVVNNAGIAESAKIEDTTDALMQRHLDVNVIGALRVMRAALPDLLRAGRGRVVNVASTAAKVGFAYTSAYAASKHALLGLTRSWALELATRGVTVNAVCPGWVETDMALETVERIVKKTGRPAEEARRILEQQSPQKRMMRPEEVAAAVVFLCSDAAAGINGQGLNVCGGMVMS